MVRFYETFIERGDKVLGYCIGYWSVISLYVRDIWYIRDFIRDSSNEADICRRTCFHSYKYIIYIDKILPI